MVHLFMHHYAALIIEAYKCLTPVKDVCSFTDLFIKYLLILDVNVGSLCEQQNYFKITWIKIKLTSVYMWITLKFHICMGEVTIIYY